MRTRQNKAIARELTLHGDITVLKLRVAELERRIRAARKLVEEMPYSEHRLAALAVLSKLPLPKRGRR